MELLDIMAGIGGEYSEFLRLMAIGLAAGTVFYFVLKMLTQKFFPNARKKIRATAVHYVPKPAFYLIVLATLSFALKSLSVLQPYKELINSTFFTIAVLITAYILGKFMNEATDLWLKSKKGIRKPPKIINKIVSATIFLLALLVIMVHFQIEITPIIATLGVGGIALGLALQGTLSNFFAGLNVLSDKPVRVGDFIELDGSATEKISGHVEDIGWRSTKIKTLSSTIVIVPNAALADSIITNYSMPEDELAMYVECGVAYESDLWHVERVCHETFEYAKENIQGILREHESFFRLREFGDSNITFRIYFMIEEYTKQFRIKSEFMKELKKRFDKEGIEISWPIMKVYRRK